MADGDHKTSSVTGDPDSRKTVSHCGQSRHSSSPSISDGDRIKTALFRKGWTRLNDTLEIDYNKPLKIGAKVYEGRQKLVGWSRVAIKIILCTEIRNESYNEVSILRDLEGHPNVIKVYDAKVMDGETLPYIYISMPLYPKSLNDILHENEKFNFDECILYAEQIVKGVAFIHDNGIQHRDIKPSNILIQSKGHCLITDFGLSKEIQDGQTTVIISKPVADTEEYQAPEVHENPPRYSYRSDSFSIGIVLSMLFSCGTHPYGPARNLRGANIMKNEDPDLSSVVIKMHQHPKEQKQLLRLLRKLLSHDSRNRPLPKEILQDPFFKASQPKHFEEDQDGIHSANVKSDSCEEASDSIPRSQDTVIVTGVVEKRERTLATIMHENPELKSEKTNISNSVSETRAHTRTVDLQDADPSLDKAVPISNDQDSGEMVQEVQGSRVEHPSANDRHFREDLLIFEYDRDRAELDRMNINPAVLKRSLASENILERICSDLAYRTSTKMVKMFLRDCYLISEVEVAITDIENRWNDGYERRIQLFNVMRAQQGLRLDPRRLIQEANGFHMREIYDILCRSFIGRLKSSIE